jgi:hypothetical protein
MRLDIGDDGALPQEFVSKDAETFIDSKSVSISSHLRGIEVG